MVTADLGLLSRVVALEASVADLKKRVDALEADLVRAAAHILTIHAVLDAIDHSVPMPGNVASAIATCLHASSP